MDVLGQLSNVWVLGSLCSYPMGCLCEGTTEAARGRNDKRPSFAPLHRGYAEDGWAGKARKQLEVCVCVCVRISTRVCHGNLVHATTGWNGMDGMEWHEWDGMGMASRSEIGANMHAPTWAQATLGTTQSGAELDGARRRGIGWIDVMHAGARFLTGRAVWSIVCGKSGM